MAFGCDLCGISSISSPVLLEAHLAGKKHLRNLEQKKALEQIAERSVFLSKFHNPTDEHLIEKSCEIFGKIDRVIVDRQNSSYAIVEFRDASVANNLINSMKKLQIGKDLVNVLPRKMDFASKPLIHTLCSVDVVNCLSDVKGKDFSSQVDELMKNFGMTPEMALERQTFANRLEEFLQRFFASKILVKIFGSSATGLGFVTSDLDITLLLPDDTSDSGNYDCSQCCSSSTSCDQGSAKAKSALSSDIRDVLANPISTETFLRLSNHEKARLVNRIINLYRKESNSICFLIPAPDARCPVVRFFLRKPCILCELSMQNILGEAKANFIRHVVDADLSGICRKLIFLVKLWAHVSGIFSTDKTHPSAEWNSYTLSLLMISFLQSRNLVPAVRIKQNSKRVQGWCIDYEMQLFDLRPQYITQLLKGFFNFLYNSLQSSSIHCIKDAVVYSREAFQNRFFNLQEDARIASKFKFSLVNVQDPLELSHNVASNISSRYISLMRQNLMYSITVLKNDPENLASLFQLEAIRLQCALKKKPRDSAQVVTVDVGHERSPNLIVQNFISIIKDVLLLEEIQEPNKKRTRRCVEEYDAALLCGDGYLLQFVAQFPVWTGRRQIRRQISAKSLQLDPLQLEREVSLEIRSKYADLLGLKFNVQLYFEDDQMHCIFVMDNHRSSQDLFHFFATFIPRYLGRDWGQITQQETIVSERGVQKMEANDSAHDGNYCKDFDMDTD